MARLAIKGHSTRGKEVIEILEMLGGKNLNNFNGASNMYYLIGLIDPKILGADKLELDKSHEQFTYFTLEEFEEKYPYKVGDKVLSHNKWEGIIIDMEWSIDDIVYHIRENTGYISHQSVNELQPYKEDTVEGEEKDFAECIEKTIQECLFGKEDMEDKGNISDGYHTFNELYEYRLLYNASMFNELAKQGLYDVHKSKRHSDGTIPFGDENWFIVQAQLPTGQISNHYEMKDWDLFQVPIKEKANPYDGHTPQDVAKRLREFLTPKPQYPTTYEECYNILNDFKFTEPNKYDFEFDWRCNIKGKNYGKLMQSFVKLLICRDAYWKIAGEELGLGKPWEPDWGENDGGYRYCIRNQSNKIILSNEWLGENYILSFPTAEIRNTFYENFKDLIEECKELL